VCSPNAIVIGFSRHFSLIIETSNRSSREKGMWRNGFQIVRLTPCRDRTNFVHKRSNALS